MTGQLINLQYHDAVDVMTPYWSELFEHFNDLTVLIDQSLHIYRHNAAWSRFAGNQQAVPKSLEQLYVWIYPEDIHVLMKALHEKSSQHIRVRLVNHQQALHWFDISINYLGYADTDENHARQNRYYCLICSDQTPQVKAQYKHQAQQRSLNDLLTRLPIMVYRSRNDRDWTMEYVSAGVKKITGYEAAELLNTPLYGQLIHPDDRNEVWDRIQGALQHQTLFQLKYRIISAQQQLITVQEVGQGVYSESDMVLGVEGVVFSDVSYAL